MINSFKNNKLLSLLTILLLIVNVITLTMLWTNKKRHANDGMQPPLAGPVFEFVTSELNLNDQQQAQYKTLREEHQLQQRPLLDSIHKAKDAFFDLLKNTSVNDSAIEQNNKRDMALQGQLELVNFKHFQKLRAICNEKQQQKFDEIIQTILRKLAAPRPLRNGPPGEAGRSGFPDRQGDPPPGDMQYQEPPPGKN